jgi:hypothetical protein
MNKKQLEFQHSEIDVTANQRFKLPNGEDAIMEVRPIFAFAGGVADEPIGITIVPSGWSKPQKYHVIVEFGDSDDWDTHFMDADQIMQKFGIEVPQLNLKRLAHDLPNNMDLGKAVRSAITKY